MKSFLRAAALVGILALLPALPAAAAVDDFTIKSFEADYFLEREAGGVSALRAKEKIIAQFPADLDQNHGILRAIPKSYRGHSLELKIAQVAKPDGSAWEYQTYSENDNLVLKIGDPDRYVRGEQTYLIEYTMRGVDSTTFGAQQFYWNVNGTQWKQNFLSVTAKIHLTPELAGKVDGGGLCFTGAQDSQASDCQIGGDGQTFIFSASRELLPNETLSIVLPFKLETFAAYSPSASLIMEWAALAAALILPPLLALAFIWRQWWRFGRDPKGRGVIVPQYLPPKDVGVLESAGILNEHVDYRAVSAAVINLAVHHYLKIYEVDKPNILGQKTSFEVELVNSPANLGPQDKEIIKMLFPGSQTVGERVALDEIGKTRYEEAVKITKQAASRLADNGYFASRFGRAKMPYIIAGIIMIAVSFFFLPHGLGLIFAGIILIIGAQFMPARTKKGVELREYLLGLRKYMELAEAERIKVLQSPHGELTEKIDAGDRGQLIKLYERLLPYAMIFGIERQWAAEFAKLYQQPPNWYSSSAAFNAAYFASSLHNFQSQSVVSFNPPSSGGSGAGGGGGGGGGGGW